MSFGTQNYSGRITNAATTIRGLIDAGKARDAITLAEEALDLLADDFELMGESHDWVGDYVYDLFEIHLLACVVPDVKGYADLLGEEGTAIIREQTGDDVYRRMATLLLSARACHEAL